VVAGNVEDRLFPAIQKGEFGELKKSLTAEIHQLLPAAAAGLASAYREAKLRYGKDDAVNASSQEVRLSFWKTKIETSFWHYCLFILPLMGIFGLTLYYHEYLAGLETKALVLKAMLSLPLLVLSAFGFASIHQNRRLYEEYNHKQRVMQLYDGFKKEIDAHGEGPQKTRLLDIMLKTVGDKPTLAMSKYEKSLAASVFSTVFCKKAEGEQQG
jgi:hypothetical protein